MKSLKSEMHESLERAFAKATQLHEAKQAVPPLSRDADLKNWNVVQSLLWKAFCAEVGWDRNDGEFFQAFGKFFFDFWGHQHMIPDVEDVELDPSIQEYMLSHSVRKMK